MIRSFVDFIRSKRSPINYARSIGVQVGENCRLISIKSGVGTFGSEPYLVSIGDHVTVAGGVQFVTHDGGVWVFREKEPDIDVFGPIKIGNNVFIGFNSILMPGVTVADNVVIGAGSVVASDVPPNSVVAGVPAKVIKTIDEYRLSISERADFVRSMDSASKKEYLIGKFEG